MRPTTEIPITPELILAGYRQGIFPMADDDGSIYWFSPNPRTIFEFDRFHVPRTVRQLITRNTFEIRIDTAFDEVIAACARRRHTWISPRIMELYQQLHRLGFAHSVEAWQAPALANDQRLASSGHLASSERLSDGQRPSGDGLLCGGRHLSGGHGLPSGQHFSGDQRLSSGQTFSTGQRPAGDLCGEPRLAGGQPPPGGSQPSGGLRLAGGLYGVAIGGAFFGESMFFRISGASKVALVALVERLKQRGYKLLDTQWTTPHLARFGTTEIPRRTYLSRLRRALPLACRFAD